ncbi:MAG: DUF4298 domain-containing protein [Clostridia bacterium]|nr:DUF4298 domain-containing protein [Clostridia bacterium]
MDGGSKRMPYLCGAAFCYYDGKSYGKGQLMVLKEQIERVSYMENCYILLLNAYRADPDSIFEDLCLRYAWNALNDYYKNGQWMEDFLCDERREFPNYLKRGILSEDTLYNFFCDMEEETQRRKVL